MSDAISPAVVSKDMVGVTGATGYVGGRLVPALLEAGYRVRCLVREPRKLDARPWRHHPHVEVIAVDIVDSAAVTTALQGCRAAYYLVHSMAATGGAYADHDRVLAAGFARAARDAGLSRIIYLGGLGEMGPDLSEHLRSRRQVEQELASCGVPVTTFLPSGVPFFFPYANLRNHRKLLVIDGEVGFTGGLNIRDGCWLAHAPRNPVHDMHFQLRGPVVAQLLEVFAEDWQFATDESLAGGAGAEDPWRPRLTAAGAGLARGIRFGPDDPDVGRIRLVIMAALAAAQTSVRIMSPYFLPDDAICQALDVAAMRGVEVDIVIPAENNLPPVAWAMTAMLWQVLGRGCNVWLSPPPFDHTKLFVVDDAWAMFGSGNWDERSLRLNFEFNVETYDRDLCARLGRHVAETVARSRRITLEDVDGRSLPVRLRDGIARLFSPYL